jgi:perosamine synthetase
MTGRELAAINDVLLSGFINEGDVTRKFESRVAAVSARRYGVAVPNGTCAIALALMACGIEHGDDVIVPDLTFIATANAVRLAGGNVILADVDPTNLCLSADAIADVVTPRSRFVIPVEVNGRRPAYRAINDVCVAYDLTMITDSCEALGSADCGSWGRASCFSFSPNKLVTTGQGGMVVTNSAETYGALKRLKFQGMPDRGSGGNDRHPALGYNFKFNDILAAVGMVQLDALVDRLAKCRERDRWYHDALSGLIEFPTTAPGETCLWTDALVDNQATLAAHFRAHGVGMRGFWFPLHTQPPYLFSRPFPATTSISRRGVWLPSNHDITQDQVGRVVDLIKAKVKHDS